MSEYALTPAPAPPPLPALDGAPGGDGDAGTAGPAGKSGRRRPARASAERQAARTAAPVLGVHVTPTALYGVLLRPTGEGFEPLRQFSRQRNGADAPADLGTGTPDMAAADGDVMLRIGEGANLGADLFLDSEFAALAGGANGPHGGIPGGMPGGGGEAAARPAAPPKLFELKDLVQECRQAGFDRPALAFCVGAPDVDYTEVIVGDEPEPKGKKTPAKEAKKPAKPKKAAKPAENPGAPVKRERLLGLLPKSEVRYDRDRIAFVPMTPRDGRRRYLAVLPRPEEPVAESLRLLREQAGMRKLSYRTLDAEVPILLGLARLAFPSESHETTALVRVGAEDTLVMLLAGNQLHHCEHMRSVTTFDGPDTICSRVLLQQDVQGIGTVHHVVIVSEEREEELVQGFAAFYPEARVETLRAGVARVGIAGPYGPLPTAAMPATGVALKALLRRDAVFEDTNLLPKALRKVQVGPKLEIGFSWHTLVVGVLLFLSVLFFVGLYLAQQRQIAEAERRLAEFPAEAAMSGPQLQARIDSLRGVKERIDLSLRVLDSLLIGSDKWTQTLARTSRAAAATGGVWVEEWAPSDSGLAIRGFATSRDRIVGLAERLGGSIEEATFQAIREAQVFQFRIRLTIPNEMPQAVEYLRERAAAQAAVGAGAPDEPLADEVALPPNAGRPPAPVNN
jgi:hypothetical protein